METAYHALVTSPDHEHRLPSGRRRPSLIIIAALAGVALVAGVSPAVGHPLGGFSISVYSRLVAEEQQIRVRWVLDMAEVAAAAVVELIDTDADGNVSVDEERAYFDLWVSSVLERIELRVDGVALPKRVGFHELSLPSGEGGAPALRVVIDLSVELPAIPAGTTYRAVYRDTNYADYIGWREVVVNAGAGVQLVESSMPTEDRTDELRTYPPDLWATPPNSEAIFTVRPGQAPEATMGTEPAASSSGVTAWPTGVLAILLVAALVTLITWADRGDHAPRNRRR